MAKPPTTCMPQVIATDLPQEDLELFKMYMRGAQISHKNNTKRHSGVDILICL